jgi:hypothetical protein
MKVNNEVPIHETAEHFLTCLLVFFGAVANSGTLGEVRFAFEDGCLRLFAGVDPLPVPIEKNGNNDFTFII